MSFVQSTAAYLWGLVNTWTGRANNAWGASRVWNSGASFESAYTTEYANARDTTGSVAGHATPGWGSGQLWSTTASQWETEAWDSGGNADSHAGASQEWKTTAAAWHTDYSNEVTAYNNEVAIANAKTTTSQSAALSGTWPNSTTSYSGNLASLTAPRTGQAQASALIYVSYSVGTHGQARVLVNGSVVATASQTGCSSGSGTICFAVQWTGTLNSGDAVAVQLASDGGTTLSSGTLDLTVGSV